MNIKTDAANLLTKVRTQVPLVHNITNYVTVNDVANVILAIGASPIMADDIAEVQDITRISSALVLNIGTLNERTIQSMIASGKKANELGIPVILDPVGAGASKLRNETTRVLTEQVKIAILRGNLSEISFVAGLQASTKGVDSAIEDEKNDPTAAAVSAANKLGCVAAVTGAVDTVSDGKRIAKITNGNKMLCRVTGTGCMTSALTGCFAGATDDYFMAAVSALLSMGIAGEIAYEKCGAAGTSSFKAALINALSLMDIFTIKEKGNVYEE